MSAQIWIFTLFIAFILWKRFKKRSDTEVLLIVFGEFERSPRMQNHTNCLLANGFKVNVVAYDSEKGLGSHQNPSLRFIPLKQPKKLSGNRILYIIRGILRFGSVDISYQLGRLINFRLFFYIVICILKNQGLY
jgi:hypothetical protein